MNKIDRANNVKFAAYMLTIAERDERHAEEAMHIQDATYTRLRMRANSGVRTGRLSERAAERYQRIIVDQQYREVEGAEAVHLHKKRMVVRAKRRLDAAIALSAGLTLRVAP